MRVWHGVEQEVTKYDNSGMSSTTTKHGYYAHAEDWLYPSYAAYADRAGFRRISFRSLLDCCTTSFGTNSSSTISITRTTCMGRAFMGYGYGLKMTLPLGFPTPRQPDEFRCAIFKAISSRIDVGLCERLF